MNSFACALRFRRSQTRAPRYDANFGIGALAMPLDPLAKRLLAMMAAAAPAERRRPTAHERRQSLVKLMQFARADAAGVSATDGTLPGPGGDIAYRLYASG